VVVEAVVDAVALADVRAEADQHRTRQIAAAEVLPTTADQETNLRIVADQEAIPQIAVDPEVILRTAAEEMILTIEAVEVIPQMTADQETIRQIAADPEAIHLTEVEEMIHPTTAEITIAVPIAEIVVEETVAVEAGDSR